ncbi:MAG: thioether cross-link-forming SCIFF peptide maturase [Clostridia bacterium]
MIHQYKLNGYNIVIDVASGSVHMVDEVVYDIIKLYETKTHNEIIDIILEKYGHLDDVNETEIKLCFEDIETLKKDNKLFADESYAIQAVDFKNNNKEVKALCMHIAHTCNLNCSYCFASQGKYKGSEALMSLEVGKKAFDFLIENSGKRHNLEVDFFGGEPLMNWNVVKSLVYYGRELEKIHDKHFRFTLTTNGVLIDDDVIDFANKEMDNVVLSLDGRKNIHDHFRVDYAGKGSYEKVVPKFKKLVEARDNKDYYMRGTFTHNNPDFVNDILHMADLGFTELSMEPVVCPDSDPYALTNDDIEVVMNQYELLADEMLKREKAGNPFTFYHYMLDLSNGPCIYKRVTGCGSGTEYFAVTPTGELYPCHQFVGKPDFLIGNVFDGIKHPEKQDEFRTCNIYAREECKECWARLYCAGGCAANSYNATGNIKGVYKQGCELFKKRIECAIMLQVAQKNEV